MTIPSFLNNVSRGGYMTRDEQILLAIKELYKDLSILETTVAEGGSGSGSIILTKTVDETKTEDIVLALDTDLQTTLEANSIYSFELIALNTCGSTPDMKVGFVYPAGTTMVWTATYSNAGFPSTESSTQSIPGSNNPRIASFRGIIYTADTAGTWGLEWAQSSSHTSETTLQKGSVILLTKTL